MLAGRNRERPAMTRITQEILSEYETAITAAARRPLISPSDWAADIPLEGGVYVVWQANSANLRRGEF